MEHSLNHQPPISVKVCYFCALIAHGEAKNLPSLLNKPQFIKISITIYNSEGYTKLEPSTLILLLFPLCFWFLVTFIIEMIISTNDIF